ncbi:Uncharacterized conserved protein YbaP, TraB family [Pustulibacterium marinum]|uniref:Uncharacterized conserved protein YbaP, TraB family n=1 Tax=Pustulibacterium marinum TaxID=1224947 RepID=A0A1I7ESZ1_9FLAO|nr:TraB/GumN family protein [Pustulibacterium marinum]SFU27033.1 Uncharacterized conserved protein YbaP, TraB family [Pustulibacterium marinum]
MRSKIFLIFLSFTSIIFSQTPQTHNSLLWEISGNGLQKPSYLYGTMHVSNKIAFRLDDVFYKALDKADFVALESDPNLWLDYYIENENTIDFSNIYQKGFYNETFAITQPKQQAVYGMLGFNGQMLNNVLYRTNVFSQNFQEETYLDMFIYQAGKKFDKGFVPLEDIDESNYMVQRSQKDMMRKEPASWLVKKLENDTYYNLLENAYRERNIAFIDSLNTGFFSENHLKYMLYERNKIMANGIEVSAKKGSTFAGIGAAHLGGEHGVLQLLKDKGFTVKPLASNKTDVSKTIKQKFEDTFNVKDLVRDTIGDGLLSVKLPNKLYHFGTFQGMSLYASPDLTNGAFFSIARMSTFPYLKGGEKFSLETLEDMFFESIPGTIISKEEIENNGFKGIDITNKLKNGDYQRYHIYKTPLEIIILKLGGKKDFTKQYSDAIFKSIQFRNTKENWETVSNTEKSFAVKMPADYSFYNPEKSGRKLIQGFDNVTGSFYLFERNTLNDFEYIEEDNFELKHIQDRFYESLEITPTYEDVVSGKVPYLISSAEIDSTTHEKIFLKTALHKGNYFLMAAFKTDREQALTYFNTLEINNPTYKKPFEQVVDTSLYFSTFSNVAMPPFSGNSQDLSLSYSTPKDDKKSYLPFIKSTSYTNANDEKIAVKLTKLHDLTMYQNIDSLWSNVYPKNQFKSFIVHKATKGNDVFGNQTYTISLADTLSNRTIDIKSILKNGAIYELRTIGDTLSTQTKFVADFYNHFQPKDTVIGVDPLQDKTALFFEKLRANDSIVITGLDVIDFAEKDFDSLRNFIDHFEFPEDKKYFRSAFIKEVAKMKNKRVEPYLRYLYNNSYEDSSIQELLLNSLATNENEKAVHDIIDWMEKDFPVGVNSFRFFYAFEDKPKLSSAFFPDLLNYTSIEEYKHPIYSMLAELVINDDIKPKIYRRYVNQLLNEAKIELKKQLSSDTSANYDEEAPYGHRVNNNYYRGWLKEYVTLLYPFKNQKKVGEFFNKLSLVKDATFNINYLVIQQKFGAHITSEMFLPYAEDLDSRSYLTTHLKNNDVINLLPEDYANLDSIAEAELYRYRDFKPGVTEHELVRKEEVTNKKGTFTVYIFKFNSKNYNNEDDWELKAIVVPPLESKKSVPLYQNSMNYNNFESMDKQVKQLLEEIQYEGRERVAIDRSYYGEMYGEYGY